MIQIPNEDLEFKENWSIELLCLDIVKSLRADINSNPNLFEDLKGDSNGINQGEEN